MENYFDCDSLRYGIYENWKSRMLNRCRRDTEYTKYKPYNSPVIPYSEEDLNKEIHPYFSNLSFLESSSPRNHQYEKIKRKFIVSKKGLKEIKERRKK